MQHNIEESPLLLQLLGRKGFDSIAGGLLLADGRIFHKVSLSL